MNNVIGTVKPNDVLCGRGGATNNHTGNITYRRIVASYQDEYLRAKKRDKRSIARKIVTIIRQENGRFLKKLDTAEGWIEVGDRKAIEKTSQALREGLEVRRAEVGDDGAENVGLGKRKQSNESGGGEPYGDKRKRKTKLSINASRDDNGSRQDIQKIVAEQWEDELRDLVSANLPVPQNPQMKVSTTNEAQLKSSTLPGKKIAPTILTRKISADTVVPV